MNAYAPGNGDSQCPQRHRAVTFRFSLEPGPPPWKVLPFRPVDVIAVIEDPRPHVGGQGPIQPSGQRSVNLLRPSDAPAAASPAQPKSGLSSSWWCLIKGPVLLTTG